VGDGMGREGDPGEFRAVRAIREAVPTRRHAEMLFEMVESALGEGAWVETVNDGAGRTLYRRESGGSALVIPWPLLTVARGGREGPSPLPTGVPGVYEAPPRRPGRAPRLRGLGPGQLDVHDGPHRATVSYGADGRWFECARSADPDALAGVVTALEEETSSPVERVADYLSGLALRRHGPGRAFLPVPLPGGVGGAWRCGLRALRNGLFAGDLPDAPGFVVADGWTGEARAHGATRDVALEAWRAEVARVRPFPETPPPDDLPEPSMEQSETEDGFVVRATLRGPSSDVPWVEPTVESSVAVVLPVMARLGGAAPIGEWTWLVGVHGTVYPAALRWEPEGFTLIGDLLAADLDPDRLEEWLVEADAAAPGRPARPEEDGAPGRPALETRVRAYRFADEFTEARLDRPAVSTSWSRSFSAGNLDGDRLRWSVVRMRPEGG